MVFKRPEDPVVGYEMTVDGMRIWVDAPAPLRDDEATQKIVTRQQELGFEWGEPCFKPGGRLRLS